jgi:hypothetical protein
MNQRDSTRVIKMRRIILLVLLLSSPAHAEANKSLYELRGQCGKQAADFFKEQLGEYPPGSDDYESHYDPRLGKCFYLNTSEHLWEKGGKAFNGMWLGELNEHRVYGRLNEEECQVLGRRCRTEQEWRELVKPFMEDW